MKIIKHYNYVGAKGICLNCGTEVELEVEDIPERFVGTKAGSGSWIDFYEVRCPNCDSYIVCSKERESWQLK